MDDIVSNQKNWLAIISILIFSLFGGIIFTYYGYLYMLRYRHHAILIKHIKARSQSLFIFNMIMNIYWASIHPLIQGLCYLFFGHHNNPIIICLLSSYSLVMLIIGLMSICLRCWILFYNFNYNAHIFEKMWQSKLLGCHYALSWYEKHKNTYGDITYVTKRALFCCILVVAVPVPYAFVSQLSRAWYFITGAAIFTSQAFFIFLTLKLHSRLGRLDHFGMRSEITCFMIVMVICTTIACIWFFQFHDVWMRLYIINIPIFTASFVIAVYSLSSIANSVKKQYKYNDVNNLILNLSKVNSNSSRDDIKLHELLQSPAGLNEFARWLIGEFCLENLLFIIQIAQFRAQFDVNNVLENDPDPEIDGNDNDRDLAGNMYKIALNVPQCAILKDYPNDPKSQAKALINTFIAHSAEYIINISSTDRNQILSTNVDKLNPIQLKELFDDPYSTIYSLLRLDTFARFKNNSANEKLIKYIHRNKKFSKLREMPKLIKETISNKPNHEIKITPMPITTTLPQDRTDDSNGNGAGEFIYVTPTDNTVIDSVTPNATTPNATTPTVSTAIDTLDITAYTHTSVELSADLGIVEALPSVSPQLQLDAASLANPFRSIVNEGGYRTRTGKIQDSIHFVLHQAAKFTNKCCHCSS